MTSNQVVAVVIVAGVLIWLDRQAQLAAATARNFSPEFQVGGFVESLDKMALTINGIVQQSRDPLKAL